MSGPIDDETSADGLPDPGTTEGTKRDAPAVPRENGMLRPGTAIFLASFLGLFVELALIRWVSSEIRVFAYCKNLILVASFLGFGTGCFLSRRRVELGRAMFVLLLLALVVRLPWAPLESYGPRRVSNILAELGGFMIFRVELADAWSTLARLSFAIGWTVLLFLVVAFVMVPFGQITAAGIARLPSPVRAYSINVAGSLAGILAYTLLTSIGAPPLVWFVPVVLGSTRLSRVRTEVQALVGVGLALTLVLLPSNTAAFQVFWSSYQKLAVFFGQTPEGPAWRILVNNTGYQNMLAQPEMPEGEEVPIDRFTMPYGVRRPAGRVLIVGAGSGNDASAALRAGASSVTAVEIDRRIYRLGAELHPQKPYSDERVEVIIDDARHYLKTSDATFDLIVFSHLDSHTLLSSYTNVRLDNYIYTVEAFEEAKSLLARGGVLYVSFFAQEPFVGDRLKRNLTEALGHAPVYLVRSEARDHIQAHNVYLLTGGAEVMDELRAVAATWSDFRTVEQLGDPVPASTDAWPFLPLERRRIPPFILLISVVIITLSLVLALRARPPGESFDGRLFWMGAAFMLVEVHNVSRLALVFGTTWQVNAWVIGTILGLILLANALFLRLQRAEKRPGRWAVGGLFVSLAVAFLVPPGLFLGVSQLWGGLLVTVLLSLPIFFAGLVFAEAFDRSSAPSFGLGWNILGAVVGGMAENLSYLWGIPAMVPLAAVFYVAAMRSRR